MGLVPAARRASSSCCASAPTRTGALLVLDEVISGFRVARGGAQELTGVHGRPDDHGQGDRRRPARRGGRRPGGADAHAGPRRRGLPGRHAVRQPAGGRRRACATLELLDEPAYVRLAAITERLAAGLREAAAARAGRYPVQVVERAGPAHGVLQRRVPRRGADRRLRGRARVRPRGVRALVPRAARARRLPAAVAVRGVVSLARAHARADRAHGRGRRGRVRGPGSVGARREARR